MWCGLATSDNISLPVMADPMRRLISLRRHKMPIVRNIDVTMQSEVSFDDACRAAVAEAAKTLRGIMSFRVKEAECVVEHDKIIAFRVTGKVVFLVER
jgi:flavin-binding protein dodecin